MRTPVSWEDVMIARIDVAEWNRHVAGHTRLKEWRTTWRGAKRGRSGHPLGRVNFHKPRCGTPVNDRLLGPVLCDRVQGHTGKHWRHADAPKAVGA